jgi:trehalose synthase
MSLLSEVPVPRRPAAKLEPVLGAERYARLLAAAARFRGRLEGRTIWTVNSTATGGGVAEMLHALAGYVIDLEIPVRWLVITGDPAFFAITKRIHNQIHGQLAGGPLTGAEAAHYREVLAANAAELAGLVSPGEIVLLHDPQTAGLTGPLVRAGALVVWRCHIGADAPNQATRAAWEFLRPQLAPAHGFVFSRQQYVPAWVPAEQAWIIPPSIDPISAKNADLDPSTVRSILATIGVLEGQARPGSAQFPRRDASTGQVTSTARVTADRLPGPDEPVVVQVSRWDLLKDMAGVMAGFTRHVVPSGGGYLVLAGPDVTGVADDPEGAAVYADCVAQWRALPPAARSRVLLAALPLHDVDENAAMVNALQRHAAVITQKSLAEGFGLTVAEGMWKGRAVVGSAVGGIADQIAEGTGVLLPDPADLRAFGAAVRRLLDDPAWAQRLGQAACTRVWEHYLSDVHLLRYARLFGSLGSRQGSRLRGSRLGSRPAHR